MSTATMVSPIGRGRPAKNVTVPVVENITPRRATQLLTLNVRNRPIRRAAVDRYLDDMVHGRWQFNGAPIIVSEEGALIDGQHRLTALVESGRTLPFAVIYDAPDTLRRTVDQGSARTPGDILAFAGYGYNAKNVAAIARMAMSREAGMGSLGGFRPSNQAILEWVQQNEDVVDAADVYMAAMKRTPANPTVVATAWLLFHRIDPSRANSFVVDRFVKGLGLSEGDPVLALKERLNDGVLSKSDTEAKGIQLRYFTLAWNIDREGRQVSKLQAPKGGWTRKNFPEPK